MYIIFYRFFQERIETLHLSRGVHVLICTVHVVFVVRTNNLLCLLRTVCHLIKFIFIISVKLTEIVSYKKIYSGWC